MKGTVLSGKNGLYRLEDKLDEGAYGIVHKAIDPSGNIVAIKTLLDDKNQDASVRLTREIQDVYKRQRLNRWTVS